FPLTRNHPLPTCRHPEPADLSPCVFRYLHPPVPQRPLSARDQFVPQLDQKRLHPGGLDRPERDAVDARRPVVALSEVVGGAQRLQLAHVNVQAPKPPVLVSLRLDVEPPPQVLQTNGRHYQATPAFRVVGGVAKQQGPVAPRALPRLLARAGPSATLSSSADFPGTPVIRPPLPRRFRGGTRRVSPLARRVLVTVPSLAPRRRGAAASARLRRSLLPSRRKHALSLRGLALSRLPLRSLTLR